MAVIFRIMVPAPERRLEFGKCVRGPWKWSLRDGSYKMVLGALCVPLLEKWFLENYILIFLFSFSFLSVSLSFV